MARLQDFMETADLLYVRLDARGRVLACNPYAAKLIGFPKAEILGENWFDSFIPEEIRADLKSRFGLSLSQHRLCFPQNYQNEILTRDGQRRLISWNNALAAEGVEVDCVGADVTASHRLLLALENSIRAAQEASASKSRYVAQMSHELRTPLNTIIGFSEIMRGELFGAMPAAYREYSDLIYTSAHHLHRLIDDVLDLAKIEASKLELAFATAELGKLVDESIALAAGQALHQNVILQRTDAANPRVILDPLRAEQVLVNILSNAINFAPGTTVSIGIRTDDDGHHVTVVDRGLGMTDEEIGLALKPFSQVAGGATRRRGAGSGLGLPLAKSLMELHGGSLAIASKPGIGTTVTLTFPLGPSPAEWERD